MPRSRVAGSVALVGAGPGDPGLITVRGLALLRGADVVVHDRLGTSQLLRMVSPSAELIDVGKGPKGGSGAQASINKILIHRARAGNQVVRLKGGDPFVFGRGGEEAVALAEAGVPFEVVPGVSSALAGPAAAGIPVTHRGSAASVAITTARARTRIDWEVMARADTTVVLMAVERLTGVVAELIAAGRAGSTPAAIVQDATLAMQRTITAPLSKIAAKAAKAGLRAPAILIVGDVVSMRDAIGGWDTRPLSGVRVMVTRTREQASELSSILRELGAGVVEAPAITVRPPRTWTKVDRAVAAVHDGGFDWIVFTSANGVAFFAQRLREASLDARAFAGVKVAAVGPGTAAALASLGIVADLVPQTFMTEAIGRAFPRGRGRVLLARADQVEPGLDDAIAAKGWTVEKLVLYRLAGGSTIDAAVKRALKAGDIDVVTFASGGTVRAFMKLVGEVPPRATKVVCIGPVTAKAARAEGLRVAAVAKHHTIPGLVAAVTEVVAKGGKKRTTASRA